MNFFRLIPVYLSALLIAAHFLRAGWLPAVVLSLLFPFILFFKRPWAARAVQTILVMASIEWVRTLLLILGQRRAAGAPWTRMVIILGVVALFTGCSALLFLCRSLKERYKL
jgi:hypothetical protein